MYLPEAFLEGDRSLALKLMRDYPLATIITPGNDLEASPAPTVAEECGNEITLRFHLAERNPHCRKLARAASCLAVFTGPNCYVSPSWYLEHPNVPTWNYVAVHAQGEVEALSPAALEAFLRDFTQTHETAVAGNWRYDDLPDEFKRELLAEIRGFSIRVTQLEAKCKLSQNRTAEDRARVWQRLSESPDPNARAVGEWMGRKFFGVS